MQPRIGSERIVNVHTDVFWVSDGILGIHIKGPCSIDTKDTDEIFVAFDRLGVIAPKDTDEIFVAFDRLGVIAPTALVADIRTLRGVSLGVRTHMSSDRAGRYLARVALVADSPLTRTIGNFFMRLNRPPFPVRIFDAEDDALRWLVAPAEEP
jgi:hypothetical protein